MRSKLEDLRERTNADSLAEVVRKALAVYDLAWSTREEGGEMLIKDAAGKTQKVLLLA